jgi:hypothetical protein
MKRADFVILSEAKDLLSAFQERGGRFFGPSALRMTA